ncbi:3 beta-hydroxysteroid dehydrogenase/Delta 5--_4-isomerase like protein [Verticillium longisporum]|nr:3 beta-hydroxysteroid dehydrogenase/Delta 5-->4-isomerase like protein [Verticillium longisporum]
MRWCAGCLSYAAISLAGAACLDAVFPGAINRMKGAIQHLTSTMAMTVLFAFPLWAIAMALWVWKVNRGMATTPPEALKHATDSPWRAELTKETYQRMEKQPCDWGPHLPPKLARRYIVVGGSGLVGGQIVLQLLQRGQAPSSIRIIDFVPPTRDELQTPLAREVEFAQTDISSEASTIAAFNKPWQATSAKLPLTVFHTAAAIRPSERHPLVYHRHARVNVGGTANVLSAAKSAGADIFIFTSSCSVAFRPVTWFSPLWRRWPTNIVQTMTEDDFSAPLRPREDFPSNYARSKAEAERHVCAADSPVSGLRTGAIRPGNSIYGGAGDFLVTAVNCLIDDSAAKRPVEEGGIGYQARCTTLEGICMQLLHLNRSVPNKRVNGKEATRSILKDVIEVKPSLGRSGSKIETTDK